jgi:SAM-dependent methyltransferase
MPEINIAIDKVKNILRQILPQSVKSFIKKARILTLRGSRFYCPVCGMSFRKFYESGINPRPNACCPNCGSLERHRLLYVALCHLQNKGLIPREGRLLHVAPESCLANKFTKKYDYLSIDLDGKKATMAMDITALAFENGSFDSIVCNHVLEHVPTDRTAISELYRVLRPGGWASIQVPINGDVTREDLSITNPKIRRRLYGQEDHVRSYGSDFFNRIRETGFSLLVLSKDDLLDAEQAKRFSVACENYVVLCKK